MEECKLNLFSMLRLSSFKQISILILCLFCCFKGYSQDIVIAGKLVEEGTDIPIPFCNIVVNNNSKGTFSNEDGEFIVKVPRLPATLIISNIAYERRVIEIKQQGSLIIGLNPASKVLDEIVIKDRKIDRYAIDLVKRAWRRTNNNPGKYQFGKAFYRQKSQNQDEFVELMEIFYDVKFNKNGIRDWEVQEGRYAEQKEELLNRNFTLMSKIFPTIQPQTQDLYLPFIENADEIYDIYLEEVLEVNNQRIAVVAMSFKSHVKRPAFEGHVYIDVKTFDVMKIKGKIQNDDLPIIKLTDKDGRFENLIIEYETGFKKDSTGTLLMDYVKFDQQFDYFIGDQFRYPVHSQSFLTFYEYYKPLRRNKRLGGKVRKRTSDRDILDLVGYNKRFWEENPIVKRTPVEEEVINSFEKDEAFGTIFLNSFDQISLNENDISEEPFLQNLLLKVKNHHNAMPIEKVYLHMDRQSYVPGESIWYAAYVVEDNDFYLSNISIVLHVDLIGPDGKFVDSHKIKLSRGKGTGHFQLKQGLPTGKYLLRAYTNWMRNHKRENYYNQIIDIFNPEESINGQKITKITDDEIDLQFFPEGGQLVAGLTSQVGFKAINKKGLGIDVEGKIVEENGKVVTFYKSAHKGMGSFFYKPKSDKQYFATLNGSKQRFKLPDIEQSGYILYAKNTHPKGIKVRLQATTDLQGEPVFLVGKSHGNIYFRQKKFFKNGTINLEVPKNKLPTGVFTLTLFDSKENPVAERVVFVNKENDFSTFFSLKVEEQDDSDEVKLKITTRDEEGRNLPTHLSLSVTDVDLAYRYEHNSNILSQLYLESELKGHLESPGYYFNEPNKTKNYALDLVMMTHGWRKFEWQNVLKKDGIPIYWRPQKGISLKGLVKEPASQKPLINQDVMLVSANTKSNFAYVSKTTNLGIFEMQDLSFTEKDNLIFKVLGKQGRVLPAMVSWEIPQKPRSNYRNYNVDIDRQTKNRLSNTYLRRQLMDTTMMGRLLEEVVVMGDIISEDGSFQPHAYLIDSKNTGTNYQNIFDMIAANTPGVSVSNNGGSSNISLDGATTPLVIIDGVEINGFSKSNEAINNNAQIINQTVTNANGAPSTTPSTNVTTDNVLTNPGQISEVLGLVDPEEVGKIEVLKGYKAASYGAKGSGGVIIIHTNTGKTRSKKPDENVLYIQEKGYETIKTFYQPKFEFKNNKKSLKYNPTLFWLPSITTDKNGEANILFSIPKKTEVQLVIEGVSYDGIPGKYSQTLKPQQ